MVIKCVSMVYSDKHADHAREVRFVSMRSISLDALAVEEAKYAVIAKFVILVVNVEGRKETLMLSRTRYLYLHHLRRRHHHHHHHHHKLTSAS